MFRWLEFLTGTDPKVWRRQTFDTDNRYGIGLIANRLNADGARLLNAKRFKTT